MKVATVFLCALALVSGDFLDQLRSLKVFQEGKHEPLVRALRESKVEITQEMVVNAMKTVYDRVFKSNFEDPDLPLPDGISLDDVRCGIHILNIITALTGNDTELWPLMMVDPWAKVQSGWLAGNIRNPGHYLQCVNLDMPVEPPAILPPLPFELGNLRGKHCTFGIHGTRDFDFEFVGGLEPPEEPQIIDLGEFWPDGLFIDLGVCFPAQCSDWIVDSIFRLALWSIGLGPTPLFTNNREHFCNTAETPSLTGLDIGALVLVGLGFGGVILTTIYEAICIKMKITPNEMTAAMSLISNGKYLFNLRRKKDHIQCLYGLRALSLIWLMLGYRFILSMVLPTINPLDFLLNFTESIFSPIIFASQFGIDVILFLNATLITFLFMNKMERTGKVRIWKLYLYRFMRVTPFIGILIFFLMTLTKFSSEGPYFNFLTQSQIPACEQYWWSALLHVQNYVNPNELCILHTWLFSVDMQLYWAAPLVLFPLFFWSGWWLIFVFTVVGLSIACAATVSFFYEFMVFPLNMIMDIDRVFDFLRMVFFATHVRMGPWLIGVFCGYVCYRLKDNRSSINWAISTLLWIVSISGVIAVIFLMYPFLQILDNETGVVVNALYIGFARNVFALCLAWWVIGCYTGSGHLVNWLLSLQIWMPLSRMGISIYLVMLSAQMVIIASQKTPLVFGSMEFLHAFDGDIVLVLIFSTVAYLMIERPIMRVMKFLLSIGTTKHNEKETLDESPELTFDRVHPGKSFY